MFQIELSSHAQRFLRKCDKTLYSRLMEKIRPLSKDPFPSDAKRVIGRKEKVFRIRVGDYRIQYVVLFKEKIVLIVVIDKRGRVYKH